MVERYSRPRAAPPTVDPAQRKFAAKRSNEMVKEAASYMRGFALGVLVLGVLRAVLDPGVEGVSGTAIALSLASSLAIEGTAIYMIGALWRRED